MIGVERGAKPQILVDNEVAWRDEFLAVRQAGGDVLDLVRYRYRHPDVKAALRRDAHGKCAYCETKIPIGEADHFLPVHHRPELIVDWGNLLLVCKECNTNKGAYYSVPEPLLNPSTEDPAEHMYFFGPAIMPRNGSSKGFRTIQRLKLGRMDLLQRRFERVDRLRPLIQEWRLQEDGPTKELLREAILEEAKNQAEYAALVRAFLFGELGWVTNGAGALEPADALEDVG